RPTIDSPSASEMETIVPTDGEALPRSTRLTIAVESPVAAATSFSDRPSCSRAVRMREPMFSMTCWADVALTSTVARTPVPPLTMAVGRFLRGRPLPGDGELVQRHHDSRSFLYVQEGRIMQERVGTGDAVAHHRDVEAVRHRVERRLPDAHVRLC